MHAHRIFTSMPPIQSWVKPLHPGPGLHESPTEVRGKLANLNSWSHEQILAYVSCANPNLYNAKPPAYVQKKQPCGMLVGRNPKHTTRRLHQNNRTVLLTLTLPQRVALPNKFFAFCQLAAEHSIFILEVNGIQVYVLVKWEVSWPVNCHVQKQSLIKRWDRSTKSCDIASFSPISMP